MDTVRLAAIAVFALGCSNATFPARGTVTVDPRFQPEVAERIDRVAQRLCRATKGALCPVLVTGSPGKYRIVRAELPRNNAVTHRRRTYVEIEVDFTGAHVRDIEAAVAHEFIHAYGVPHQTRGLMRGEAHGGPWARKGVTAGCFDQHTLAALCDAHDCGFIPECFEP